MFGNFETMRKNLKNFIPISETTQWYRKICSSIRQQKSGGLSTDEKKLSNDSSIDSNDENLFFSSISTTDNKIHDSIVPKHGMRYRVNNHFDK